MKKFKRIISLCLAFVLVVSLFSINSERTYAAVSASVPTIRVEEAWGAPGSTVDVNVVIENNTGIMSAVLVFDYDSRLTLIDAKAGDAFSALDMTKPGLFSTPCKFAWDALELSETDIKDGSIITLTFQIAKEVEAGEILDINASYEEIYDQNLQMMDVEIVSNQIQVIDYTPGDLNNDGKINTADVISLRRYIVGGYNLSIKEKAANVNKDRKKNTADAILIRRYIVGGYGVILYPEPELCEHIMEEIEAKAATCTEDGNNAYWYCSSCRKYFEDVNGEKEITLDATVIEKTGHTLKAMEAKEPTYTEEGNIAYWYCSACEKYFKTSECKEEDEITNLEDLVIPKLKPNEYNIVYHIDDSDEYLKSLNIENPNQKVYTNMDKVVLKNVVVAGYRFKGWYDNDSSTATQIKEIPVGTTGDIHLYAQWEKVPYIVTFDSPDVPVESVTYTVDTGITLKNPSWFGYTFIGWSNDNGFIVSRIKPGTTGNITLHANWTSNRNKARSYENYGDPLTIIEDDENGQFLFVYDIGRIDNVPLAQIEYIGNTQSLVIDKEYEIIDTITEETAKTIVNTISDATTKSSAWTLEKEWNKVYGVGEEVDKTNIMTEERTDEEGRTVGGNYFVSNSSGGSSYMSTESGGSNSTSAKVTTDKSYGINMEYDDSTEKYCDATLGVENKTEVGAGVEVPVGVAKVSADVKNTTTIGAEVTSGRKDNTSFHVDSQASTYVGTVDTSDESSYYNVSANQSSSWNSTSGYEKSYAATQNTKITNAISEAITEKTSYNFTESLGGTNSTEETVGSTVVESEEYSTTVKYSKGTAETTSKRITYNSDRPGYYRLVTAGTVHVFGVVGYDVATASYYTYSFNVLADETYEYLDYSKDNAKFDDCENGLVTFEVPFEVNEYISSIVGKKGGLEYDLKGGISGFDAEADPEFDGTVVVPQYQSVDNGDGSYSAYKTEYIISAISGEDKEKVESVFSGEDKEKIKKVVLPLYVTKIPEGAFDGCKNLKMIVAYGVTEIDKDAFKGCTSLTNFCVDNKITFIGENAFESVPEIKVMAASPEVAKAAINSGAKKITLDISKMEGSFDNEVLVVPETVEHFMLISNGTAYNNLQIHSKATKSTYISNMKFVNNTDIPLKIDSPEVTLNRVIVEDSPGFALVLNAPHTDLALFGTIELGSTGENAVISRSVIFKKASTSVIGKMQVSGNYLVCGTVSNDSMLSIKPGELKTIDETEFNNMLTSSIVTFDGNEGTVLESETKKTVYYEQKYGTLPTPTREYHTFLGWFTEPTGGTKITEDTVVQITSPQTLYAQWELNVYTIAFDAKGGSVSETSRIVPCGQAIGELPIPTLDYYTFGGWFTEDGNEVSAETVMNSAGSITLNAYWILNEPSGWTLASEVPEGAAVVENKWTYTLRSTTTSGSSTLAGWTQYNRVRTSWGAKQGPVYSDPSNGVRNVTSEQYVTSSTTYYNYYRYSSVNADRGGDSSYTNYGNCIYYRQIRLTSQLNATGSMSGHTYYSYNGNWWWQCPTFTTTEHTYGTRWYYQEPVYTYYYEKYENLEAAEEPSGNGISNVQKWVKYRAK